jgi:hypothetical protein
MHQDTALVCTVHTNNYEIIILLEKGRNDTGHRVFNYDFPSWRFIFKFYSSCSKEKKSA